MKKCAIELYNNKGLRGVESEELVRPVSKVDAALM